MVDDEPSGLDALEAQITSYTDHKYFIPVTLVAILLLYGASLASYTGLCEVAGTTEAISIFEPTSIPESPACKYAIKPLLILTGLMLVFVVPGYAWTIGLFDDEEIDAIERFTIAFAVSIALVVLSIIYLNMLMGIKITRLTVIGDIALITLLGLAYWGWKREGWFGGKVPVAKPASD